MATNTTRRPAPSRATQRPAEIAAALDGIRRIVQTLRLSARSAEQRLGISGAQLFVLHALAESPARSLNDLAARTFTHQSSVSVVVDRLARRRLVSRERSTEDGRRVTLALTPAGRALLRSAPEVAQIRLIDALRSLPPADRRALARILERMVDAMGVARAAPLLFDDAPEPGRARRAARRR